jgi:hypothetical protein
VAREYVFVEEWDVDAPVDVVYGTPVRWNSTVFADQPLLPYLTP